MMKKFGLNEINRNSLLSVLLFLPRHHSSYHSSPPFFVMSSFFPPSFLSSPFHQPSTSIWLSFLHDSRLSILLPSLLSPALFSPVFLPSLSIPLSSFTSPSHPSYIPQSFLHFNSQKSLFDSPASVSSSLVLFSSPRSPAVFLLSTPLSHLIFQIRSTLLLSPFFILSFTDSPRPFIITYFSLLFLRPLPFSLPLSVSLSPWGLIL